MRIACGTAALLGLCLLIEPGSARAQEDPPDRPHRRSITVVGVGRDRSAPDTVDLQFAVEHVAPTARAAGQAAAASATKVVEALRKQIGEAGRVETSGYQLYPVYSDGERPPGKRERPQIVGYTATNQIHVTTRKIDAVGALIDEAIAAGAARISSLTFTIEDVGPKQAAALRAAGADAAAQADAIASALNVRITQILEANTEGTARPIPQRYADVAMSAEAAAIRTPIEAGEVATEVRLRVTYGIE